MFLWLVVIMVQELVLGTLFGEQIAIKASNENTKEINVIESRNKPTWLPPKLFLNLGIRTRLMYEKLLLIIKTFVK